MPRIWRICAVAITAFAIGGTVTASASAAKVLTLYANGEPLTLGNRETSPFSITSTAPFTLTTPSTGAVVTCTPKKSWMLRGYLTSNGAATVKVTIDSEGNSPKSGTARAPRGPRTWPVRSSPGS